MLVPKKLPKPVFCPACRGKLKRGYITIERFGRISFGGRRSPTKFRRPRYTCPRCKIAVVLHRLRERNS